MATNGTHSRIALQLQDSLHVQLRSWRRRLVSKDAARLIMRIAFVAVMGLLVYSVKASANESAFRPIQSLNAVRSAAEQYIQEAATTSIGGGPSSAQPKVIVTAAEPDSRLQLADCGTDLRAFALNGAPIGGRNTIGVRCRDETRGAWTLYLSVTVEVEKPVLILKRSLARDAHVANDDIETQIRRVPGLGASFPSDIASLRDQHLKRGAPAGSVLSSDILTRDLLVKRGQEVFLVLEIGGVSVRAPGLALADGGFSDRVRVQNRTSLKVVEGTVESGNLVRVGM
jgi:flagellar basal body P-ring formation protein FlgA